MLLNIDSSQIQVSVDVYSLLLTTTDCLRFVTEFFEVISQSAPHIYHSALLLAPKSSVVRRLYGQQICSPSRVVTGIPDSWDSCTASLGGTTGVRGAAWSQCGKFIAVCFKDRVAVQNSTTLERVSELRPPTSPVKVTPISLSFSHDGCLLACVYLPLLEPDMSVLPPISLLILTSVSRLNVCTPPCTVVWDIQTGMVIKEIHTWETGKVAFSGDQRTITFIARPNLYAYDGFSGEQVCEGKLLPSSNHQLGHYWVDEGSLLFATSYGANGELTINIQKLQPASDPPLFLVESFQIPHQVGTFSFSPVSFHASFLDYKGIVILDVKDSKVLLQAQPGGSPTGGEFSPNGCFFICGARWEEIHIWENTSDGYVPWSVHKPRFRWDGFLCSPNSISIMCWGDNGIQLLHLGSSLGSMYSDEPHHQRYENHLVAYSADQTHIATLRERGGTITVLDLSDATQQSINTDVDIWDIRIVNDTIFAIDGKRLFSWHFATGEQIDDASSTESKSTTLHAHLGSGSAVLSNDCSQVAFVIQGHGFNPRGAVFLYDIEAQKVVANHTMDGAVIHIWFSSDGHQLWSIVQLSTQEKCYTCCCMELGDAEDPCITNITTEHLEGEWSLDTLFRPPLEHRIIGTMSDWVYGPRGHVLWLPPNWRTWKGLNARWDGNFLALLGQQLPDPIIIEFQP